jgi:hypothetical protein
LGDAADFSAVRTVYPRYDEGMGDAHGRPVDEAVSSDGGTLRARPMIHWAVLGISGSLRRSPRPESDCASCGRIVGHADVKLSPAHGGRCGFST